MKRGRSSRVPSPKRLDRLREKGVQKVPTLYDLRVRQDRMLASFANADVPRKAWRHLKRCKGKGCPHPRCSAACWFGERAAYLNLVEQATPIFESLGVRMFWVTVVDLRQRVAIGELGRVSLAGMKQRLSRRLANLEERYGPLVAIGGVEVCLDKDADDLVWLAPHMHFVIAFLTDPQLNGRKLRRSMRRVLRPHGELPRGARPVLIKEVYSLANAIDYAMKRCPAERQAYVDRRDTIDRFKHRVERDVEREHDLWLLGQPAAVRLFMRGLLRIQDRLVLLKRR